MAKRYLVSGVFILEVVAEDNCKASEKVERIMRDSGIEGYVVEVEEVGRDKKTRKEFR